MAEQGSSSKPSDFATREELVDSMLAVTSCAVATLGTLQAMNAEKRDVSNDRLDNLNHEIRKLLKLAERLVQKAKADG